MKWKTFNFPHVDCGKLWKIFYKNIFPLSAKELTLHPVSEKKKQTIYII